MRHGCLQPNIAGIDKHIQLSMQKRGWTVAEIQEAYGKGNAYSAVDETANGSAATRFVHPTSGKSVVINNATGKIIHVGGKNFLY